MTQSVLKDVGRLPRKENTLFGKTSINDFLIEMNFSFTKITFVEQSIINVIFAYIKLRIDEEKKANGKNLIKSSSFSFFEYNQIGKHNIDV